MAMDLVDALSLLAVVFAGLPHGAMDGTITMYLGFIEGVASAALFIAVYVGISATVVGVWLRWPVTSLTLFLLISMLHFGLGDSNRLPPLQRLVQIACHGGGVLTLISLWHRDEVDAIFRILAGEDISAVWFTLELLGLHVLPVAGALYAALACLRPEVRPRFLELALLLPVLAWLRPLAGFALYFTCIHSRRHMNDLWPVLQKQLGPYLVRSPTALFTIASAAAGSLAFALLAERGEPPEAAALQVTFIGLASLTAPHMLLVDGIFRSRRDSLACD